MRFWTELKKLTRDFEKLTTNDLSCSDKEVKFINIKNEILDILRKLYGENSREFKVVKQTTSSITITKVINHILGREDVFTVNSIAVNM